MEVRNCKLGVTLFYKDKEIYVKYNDLRSITINTEYTDLIRLEIDLHRLKVRDINGECVYPSEPLADLQLVITNWHIDKLKKCATLIQDAASLDSKTRDICGGICLVINIPPKAKCTIWEQTLVGGDGITL